MPFGRPQKVGDYLMVDDESGRTYYRSEMVQRWDGQWVHWTQDETRQPQEFVRALRDPAALQHIRPDTPQATPSLYIPEFVGDTTTPTTPDGPAWHLFQGGIGLWTVGLDFTVT